MPKKIARDDFDKFQDHNCYIPERMVYFGITGTADDGDGGVDFHAAKILIKNLLVLDKQNKDDITIYLNTPGGDFYHGLGIYDMIKSLRSKVTIIGHGYLMSMGMIILQAADKRYLTTNCGLMIHDGYDGFEGDCKSFEAWADECKYTRKLVYEIYHDKMVQKDKSITKKKIEEMCSHDKILRAKEAVKIGLADKVLK